MDIKDLRNCFGHFATGVTVVTWNDGEGHRKGITINSFTSVSLDPPLALISIDKRTKAVHDLQNRSFVINVLSANQIPLALQFAGKPQEGLEVEWMEDSEVGPRIANTVATLECTPWKRYDGGDHVLFLGKVEDYLYNKNDSLLFHKGQFFPTMANTTVAK